MIIYAKIELLSLSLGGNKLPFFSILLGVFLINTSLCFGVDFFYHLNQAAALLSNVMGQIKALEYVCLGFTVL